ncbi:hypothetical protein BP6252_01932 [Coleophoma cylindrospora]|uniref:Uncharacterized protein n=1 Tax=Coleophoma cylindrospora TaxID=1849047 RepID=A0A3D8SDE6_9HELO|nr:hypothetical protein BP6252_01932 [Coleophoma cylindrospora]
MERDRPKASLSNLGLGQGHLRENLSPGVASRLHGDMTHTTSGAKKAQASSVDSKRNTHSAISGPQASIRQGHHYGYGKKDPWLRALPKDDQIQ